MSNTPKCKALFLSGFLGSGKTTLLRRLLATVPAGERTVVLMNEFGKAGVDGDIIREHGLKIVEINRGSIFCACAKGDYLRALHTIRCELQPTLLLIETSGVADTSDMERDLNNEMLSGIYQACGNICVVDAERFERWLDLFNATYKQVKTATHIVVNKTDLVGQDDLTRLAAVLRDINPKARTLYTAYGEISWRELFPEDIRPEQSEKLPGQDKWEEYVNGVLATITSNMKPPDNLMSLCVFWEGNPISFRKILEDLPNDLIRAKGYFADEGGKWRIFDIVGQGCPVFSDTNDTFSPERNLAVFIRQARDRREIPALFQANGLKVLEVRF